VDQQPGSAQLDSDDPGEIEAIRAAFDEESLRNPALPVGVAAAAAVVGLDARLGRRSSDITVLTPTTDELALAVRLQDRSDRAWRQELGVRARRLDSGESVSIAIAVARGFGFASDDDDARVAYLALGGGNHYWTLDLIQAAVDRDLIDERTAMTGYEDLRLRYRFWGPDWR
jgi:predicted nucleic acid-binding protein